MGSQYTEPSTSNHVKSEERSQGSSKGPKKHYLRLTQDLPRFDPPTDIFVLPPRQLFTSGSLSYILLCSINSSSGGQINGINWSDTVAVRQANHSVGRLPVVVVHSTSQPSSSTAPRPVSSYYHLGYFPRLECC